jgi:hypothetical protein
MQMHKSTGNSTLLFLQRQSSSHMCLVTTSREQSLGKRSTRFRRQISYTATSIATPTHSLAPSLFMQMNALPQGCSPSHLVQLHHLAAPGRARRRGRSYFWTTVGSCSLPCGPGSLFKQINTKLCASFTERRPLRSREGTRRRPRQSWWRSRSWMPRCACTGKHETKETQRGDWWPSNKKNTT